MAAATPAVPEVALTSQEKRLDLSAEAGEAKGQVELQRLSLQIFRYLLANLSYIQFFCGLPSPSLPVPCSSIQLPKPDIRYMTCTSFLLPNCLSALIRPFHQSSLWCAQLQVLPSSSSLTRLPERCFYNIIQITSLPWPILRPVVLALEYF